MRRDEALRIPHELPVATMKTIAIRCTAAVNLNLADLTPLQGELKELTTRVSRSSRKAS